MKISKKDLQLLLLLGLVLIGAAYYWLMYLPQEVALNSLKVERAALMQQRVDVDNKLKIAPTLDRDIDSTTKLISAASERYYGELYQEVLMMTIRELVETTGLVIKGIQFSEQSEPLQNLLNSLTASQDPNSSSTNADGSTVQPTTANLETSPEPVSSIPTPEATGEEQITETHVTTLTALIQFEGNYTDLESFMYNLYKYPKQLVIQSLSISSNIDGLLSGVLAVEFYGMPKIGFATESLKEFFSNSSKRSAVTDVFKPYTTFVLPDSLEEEPDFTNDVDVPEETDVPTDLIPEEPPSLLVSSFEDFDYFFTGDNVSIVGSASRTVVRTDGNYGLKVQYNFVDARTINTANVVFDQNPLIVNEPGVSLAVNAYSERANKHRIGAELIDSTGKSYIITFAMGLQPTGWQTLQVPIPDEINYPFVVKRLFFEGTGVSQQLVAEVILDELRVMLPDLGGSQ